MIREVGEAFLGVVRAEIAALAEDLRSSRRKLARVLVLAFLCGALVFWAVATAIELAVELLALALPRWAALLIVLALLVTLAAAVGAAARRRLAAIETPAETLRRRMEESRRWWRTRIETEVDDAAGAADAEDGGDEP